MNSPLLKLGFRLRTAHWEGDSPSIEEDEHQKVTFRPSHLRRLPGTSLWAPWPGEIIRTCGAIRPRSKHTNDQSGRELAAILVVLSVCGWSGRLDVLIGPVDNLTAHNSHHHLRIFDFGGGNSKEVVGEHNDISEFPGCNAAFLALLEGRVGGAFCVGA